MQLQIEQLPTLSVVLITHQGETALCETITHLLALSYPHWELLVVDQTRAHEPSTHSFLQQMSRHIRYMHTQKVGMCHARNVGLNAARGEIVLFCGDRLIPDQSLLKMHARHYQDDSVGGVTGVVTTPPASVDAPLKLLTGGESRREPPPTSVVDTDRMSSGNMSFRRQLLMLLGGFDEGFILRAHREETDVALRVQALGYRLLYDPGARVDLPALPVRAGRSAVESDRDTLDWENQRLFGLFHNNAYFFGKHLSLRYLPSFLGAHLGHLFYRQAWQRRRPNAVFPALAGLGDGLRRGRKARRQMLRQRKDPQWQSNG